MSTNKEHTANSYKRTLWVHVGLEKLKLLQIKNQINDAKNVMWYVKSNPGEKDAQKYSLFQYTQYTSIMR